MVEISQEEKEAACRLLGSEEKYAKLREAFGNLKTFPSPAVPHWVRCLSAVMEEFGRRAKNDAPTTSPTH